MNVLIANFHSARNKGDLGIVLGLMAGIRQRFPQVSFAVIGKRIDEREWWATQGVEFCLPLLSYKQGKFGRLAALWLMVSYWLSLRSAGFLSLFFRGPEAERTIAAYKKADLVVSKGGSFFREPDYRRNILPVGIVGHLHQLAVAQALGKPVAISAQSFGPINNPLSRKMLRKVLERCSVVTVRDSASANYLHSKVGLRRAVVVAGDSAFLLKGSSAAKGEGSQRSVGITVRAWSHNDQFDSYLSALAEFMGKLSSQGFKFTLMPQVVGPSRGEDDRIVSQQLVARLSPEAKAATTVVEDELEPQQLVELYSQMDYFVATRLHSSIFALLGFVPVMAIAYEPKTMGIFSDLSLQQFVVDIRKLNAADLEQTFDRLAQAPLELFKGARQRAIELAQQSVEAICATVSP